MFYLDFYGFFDDGCIDVEVILAQFHSCEFIWAMFQFKYRSGPHQRFQLVQSILDALLLALNSKKLFFKKSFTDSPAVETLG